MFIKFMIAINLGKMEENIIEKEYKVASITSVIFYFLRN